VLANGGKSGTDRGLDVGVAAFVLAAVVAAVAGAAVPWAWAIVVVTLVAAACVVRLGATTVLLHALVLSMFFESVAVGEVRVGRLLAVVVPVYVLFRLLRGWRPGRIPGAVWLPAALFAVWAWASGLWATSDAAWQASLGAIGLAAAYFLGFATLVDSPAQIRELLRTYVLGAAGVALLAMAQAGVDVRSVGLQGDPNIFALYQVAAIPAVGMLARTAKVPWQRLAWLLLILPLTASVFASQSRGGLLSLAVVLPVALVRGDFGRIVRGHTVFAMGATTVVLGVLGGIAGRIDDRLSVEAILRDQGTGRLDIWLAAWHGYLSNPLLGLGAGGFQPQSSWLLETTPGVGLSPDSAYFRTGIKVHNVYLETLAELGPVGLLLWLAILAGTVVLILRVAGAAVRSTPASALLPMLFAFAVATLFLSVTNNKLLWMVVGISAAAASARFRTVPDLEGPSIGWWGDRPLTGPGGEGPAGIARRDPTRAFITYSARAESVRRSPIAGEGRPVPGDRGKTTNARTGSAS
jgi:O-antigen ligase